MGLPWRIEWGSTLRDSGTSAEPPLPNDPFCVIVKGRDQREDVIIPGGVASMFAVAVTCLVLMALIGGVSDE
jgi:hypothetical protein